MGIEKKDTIGTNWTESRTDEHGDITNPDGSGVEVHAEGDPVVPTEPIEPDAEAGELENYDSVGTILSNKIQKKLDDIISETILEKNNESIPKGDKKILLLMSEKLKEELLDKITPERIDSMIANIKEGIEREEEENETRRKHLEALPKLKKLFTDELKKTIEGLENVSAGQVQGVIRSLCKELGTRYIPDIESYDNCLMPPTREMSEEFIIIEDIQVSDKNGREIKLSVVLDPTSTNDIRVFYVNADDEDYERWVPVCNKGHDSELYS